MCVPLGIPLIFMLSGSDVTVASLFADSSFRSGLLLQAVTALWSGVGLYSALKTRTPETLRLKLHFALVLLRWIALLAVTYTGIVLVFGRFAAFIYVAIYAAVSIVVDVAPDKFLRVMPGGAEDADPVPGAPISPVRSAPGWKGRDKSTRKP